MWTTVRSALLRSLSSTSPASVTHSRRLALLAPDKEGKTQILKLEEVEKVLSDVKADNITVIPVSRRCDWTDFMVFATGRSTVHLRNIAQALVYKAKQKQRGAPRMLLPSVEGQEGGNWIVIDSGKVVIHALDEKARVYYDMESHWTSEKQPQESSKELARTMEKVRRRNSHK